LLRPFLTSAKDIGDIREPLSALLFTPVPPAVTHRAPRSVCSPAQYTDDSVPQPGCERLSLWRDSYRRVAAQLFIFSPKIC